MALRSELIRAVDAKSARMWGNAKQLGFNASVGWRRSRSMNGASIQTKVGPMPAENDLRA